LRILTGKKLGELEDTLALFRRRGNSTAVNVVRTDVGKRTMDQIGNIVGTMRTAETRELSAATAEWQTDFKISRWVSTLGVVLNLGLVLLATRLVYGDMRRRARQAVDLSEQKQQLKRQVDERTQDLTALSTHLQEVSEQEKSALSRELHDELGGLLIAVKMDVSWLQKRLPAPNPDIQARWARIIKVLDDGVDFKRRIVENLRPTLLDNMGLVPAVRWITQETCTRAGLQYTELYPEVEPQLIDDAAIMSFRLVQESLINVVKHARATHVHVELLERGDELVIVVEDNGTGIEFDRREAVGSHGLATMRHRVRSFGGTLDIESPPNGGTRLQARIPLAAIQREPAIAVVEAAAIEVQQASSA
jgi:hypothetical protein